MGSARIITNENGAVTKRQDYGAFGDEIITSQRTSRTDYTTNDELREGYTGYEKDDESGLDYAQARYYNSTHGRFTSVDPLTASATIKDPQSFNRYTYVLNSPYKFTDPLGLLPLTSAGACGSWCRWGMSGGVTEFDYVQASPGYKIWVQDQCSECSAGDSPVDPDRNKNAHRPDLRTAQNAQPPVGEFKLEINENIDQVFSDQTRDVEIQSKLVGLYFALVNPNTDKIIPFEYSVESIWTTKEGETIKGNNKSEKPEEERIQIGSMVLDSITVTTLKGDPYQGFILFTDKIDPTGWEGTITVKGGEYLSVYKFKATVSRVKGDVLTPKVTYSLDSQTPIYPPSKLPTSAPKSQGLTPNRTNNIKGKPI